MELALYSKAGGYYTGPDRISARGDYFTSPSAHPAFGALISVQLRKMWHALGAPEVFHVVELGAGTGVLARDITSYSQRLDERFAASLLYTAIDRAVPDAGAAHVAHGSIPPSNVTGCVLSNELLDAFPVHRFVVERGRVREIYVALDGDRLVETHGDPSTPQIEGRLGSIAATLPDGFRGEVNLGLDEWADGVSGALARGFVLTIDFGHPGSELYSHRRRQGTLRCYYRHTLGADAFQHIGHQDISAHVDFTALDRAMARNGLDRLGRATQGEFLTRLGLHELIKRLRRECQSQRDVDANRMAMLELSKPEGLGAFKVAVHGRGVAGAKLTGLDEAATGKAASRYPLPLLNRERGRVHLLEGKYPATAGLAQTWEEHPRRNG